MASLSVRNVSKSFGAVDVLKDFGIPRQVLGNLLSNAIKYSPDGGRITARARRTSTTNSSRSGATDAARLLPHAGRPVATGGIPPPARECLARDAHRASRVRLAETRVPHPVSPTEDR